MSKKFERLLEYVVNNETEKADALFHEIVVAKSREIYENLIADEAEGMHGGDDVEGLMDEISADEDMAFEADDDMMSDMGDEDMGDEDMGDEDMGGDEMPKSDDDMDAELPDETMASGEGEGLEDFEDRLVDLEDALKKLQADALKSQVDASDDEGEEMDDEEGEEKPVMEFVEKAPKPVTSEPSGVNKTSVLAKGVKSPTGAGSAVQIKDGAEGKHGHGSASAPKPGKMTTAGNKVSKLTKVSTPSNKG
jgi:hypothetical protein